MLGDHKLMIGSVIDQIQREVLINCTSPNTRGGGHFRNFWVGMCRWEPGTLILYQS